MSQPPAPLLDEDVAVVDADVELTLELAVVPALEVKLPVDAVDTAVLPPSPGAPPVASTKQPVARTASEARTRKRTGFGGYQGAHQTRTSRNASLNALARAAWAR